ncbi:MAG: DEAD/DEAH box helicase [Clostridiales bacterium]|nr:DEAD/DEAH box helicase [Clostridiales bacterium]
MIRYMGLGKTYVGSEKMKQLGARVNLLICQKSKISDWAEHFKEQYSYDVFDLTDKNQFEAFINAKNDCIGIINYELVFRRESLKKLKDFTLMLDESSLIQNEKTKRSRFILNLKPKNVILLSGTPTSGKYERLWSQLKLLGWGISKDLYYKQYVDMEWIEDRNSGFRIPHIVGYKNVDRLKSKISSYGAVFMKSDEVFELPEQTIIPIYTKPADEYERFMRDSIVTVNRLEANVSDLESTVEYELIGDTTLTKRLYARQLCSQFSKSRIKAFKDLINSTNERLIVFYNFNAELEIMMQVALKKTANISIVNGKRKDLQAYEIYDDSITFVQYQAGSKGLNLQKANRIIYFSLTDSCENWMQSQKRIHRIGQKKACFYYVMMSRNTLESHIWKALQQGIDYTDELFKKYDEKYRRK